MSRMANAGVETGANMFGVCTGPPSPKAPGAPRALEASPLSPTIVAARIAHITALNPWHGGRSTNRHRAFSTGFVAWLTLPSSRPVLPLIPDHVRWLLVRCGPRQHEFGPALAPRRVHTPRPRATPWRRRAPRLRAAASNDGQITGVDAQDNVYADIGRRLLAPHHPLDVVTLPLGRPCRCHRVFPFSVAANPTGEPAGSSDVPLRIAGLADFACSAIRSARSPRLPRSCWSAKARLKTCSIPSMPSSRKAPAW